MVMPDDDGPGDGDRQRLGERGLGDGRGPVARESRVSVEVEGKMM